MIQVVQLIRKDFIVDWRRRHPFFGVLLYLSATVLTAYVAFRGFLSVEVWNALFWVILLFITVNVLSGSFERRGGRNLYYFFLAKPEHIILGKLIYSFVTCLILSLAALTVYILLFGSPIFQSLFFLLNLFLGVLGMSAAFTMVSAIAFNTTNQAVMMVVLGFPAIIPVLVLAINNSDRILNGNVWAQFRGNMLSLFATDVIIITLTFVLFPFVWRS